MHPAGVMLPGFTDLRSEGLEHHEGTRPLHVHDGPGRFVGRLHGLQIGRGQLAPFRGGQHFAHTLWIAVRKDGPIGHGHGDKTDIRAGRQFLDQKLQPDPPARARAGSDAAFQCGSQRHALFCQKAHHRVLRAIKGQAGNEHHAENEHQGRAESSHKGGIRPVLARGRKKSFRLHVRPSNRGGHPAREQNNQK